MIHVNSFSSTPVAHILHVVGFSLNGPAGRTTLGLAQAFRASRLIGVNIFGSNWWVINLHLRNPSCAELAEDQYADSRRFDGLPGGASDTSAVGNNNDSKKHGLGECDLGVG